MQFIADNLWVWLVVALCAFGFVLQTRQQLYRKYQARIDTDIERGLSVREVSKELRWRLKRDTQGEVLVPLVIILSFAALALFFIALSIRYL